jgi:ribulose-phosphate 3-epimerase
MMCARLGELAAELKCLEDAGIDSFHFDIMDGHFVPNLALTPDIMAALRPLTARPFLAHLMVDNPRDYIKSAAAAGTDVFVFHLEATHYPGRLIAEIADAGMTPGVAINPATAVSGLEAVAGIAWILVMSVEPGFAGAEWIANSPERVRMARDLCGDDANLAVDGHINRSTARVLKEAGANVFTCGTKSVFSGTHAVEAYRSEIQGLRQTLTTAIARLET